MTNVKWIIDRENGIITLIEDGETTRNYGCKPKSGWTEEWREAFKKKMLQILSIAYRDSHEVSFKDDGSSWFGIGGKQ